MKKIIADIVIATVGALLVLTLFAGAFLQESYRLNPPTEAERAESPWLVDFLAGGER